MVDEAASLKPEPQHPAIGLPNRIRQSLKRCADLDFFNKVLVAAAIALAAYFVFDFTVHLVKIGGAGMFISAVSERAAAKGAEYVPKEAGGSGEGYRWGDPGLSNRNVFQPKRAEIVIAEDGSSEMAYRRYRLAGVAAVGKPKDQYALVENTQTKLTHFLPFGQDVEGLKLERIQDDKVIVNIGGSSIELERK